jgi:hypothetical protein
MLTSLLLGNEIADWQPAPTRASIYTDGKVRLVFFVTDEKKIRRTAQTPSLSASAGNKR